MAARHLKKGARQTQIHQCECDRAFGAVKKYPQLQGKAPAYRQQPSGRRQLRRPYIMCNDKSAGDGEGVEGENYPIPSSDATTDGGSPFGSPPVA